MREVKSREVLKRKDLVKQMWTLVPGTKYGQCFIKKFAKKFKTTNRSRPSLPLFRAPLVTLRSTEPLSRLS
jgi:DNA-binding transcriptional regulator PaaX